MKFSRQTIQSQTLGTSEEQEQKIVVEKISEDSKAKSQTKEEKRPNMIVKERFNLILQDIVVALWLSF